MSKAVRLAVATLTVSAAGLLATMGVEGFRADPHVPTQGDRPTIGHGSTVYEDGTPVRKAEKSINTNYQEALNAARTREAQLRRDPDQLRTVSDGLREQSADAARRLASAPPAAVLEYATALGVVFEDCRAAYGDMAAAAAGHAADVKTFMSAWPVVLR